MHTHALDSVGKWRAFSDCFCPSDCLRRKQPWSGVILAMLECDQKWVWSFKMSDVANGCRVRPRSSVLTYREGLCPCLRVRKGWTFCKPKMGPVRIRHSSHDFGWQSSHSLDLAGWQAKMASIEIWIPQHNAHKPHSRHLNFDAWPVPSWTRIWSEHMYKRK